MKEKTVYITDDGCEFDKPEEARQHERKKAAAAEDALIRYENTHGYKRLRAGHLLTEEGIWEVRGEDPNCDLGGPHHNPYIGTVSGTLDNVIRWAVVQPSFWQWGSGGVIKKVEVKNVEDL